MQMIKKTGIVEAVGIAFHEGRKFTLDEVLKLYATRKMWKIAMSKKVPSFIRHRAQDLAISLFNFGFISPAFSGGSKGNTHETDLLKLLFTATAIANVADNAASSPLTNISVALHTADPGEAGDQTTSESAYTSYARVSVARTSGGWTVASGSCSPAANIDFPAGTGGSGTVTYFSVGPTGGGATRIFYSGTVTPNIVTGNGVTPRLTTSSTITED